MSLVEKSLDSIGTETTCGMRNKKEMNLNIERASIHTAAENVGDDC